MKRYIDTNGMEMEDKVVAIKRVTKVVKGGRNMRFAALVVVGDKNGHVGAGLGKAAEVPEAIRKAKEDAMKKVIALPIDENGSIPHDFIGNFGSASVLLKRASVGTGIIAGGPARIVLELAGSKYGGATVLLKKAPEGTGIIAGGPARMVLEMAGVKNIRTKSLGSNNKQNVVLATIAGLSELKTPEEVAARRGISVSNL